MEAGMATPPFLLDEADAGQPSGQTGWSQLSQHAREVPFLARS